MVNVFIACLLVIASATAQIDTCSTCAFPCKRSPDEVFTVRLTGGRPDPSRAFSRVIRDTVWKGGEYLQAFRFTGLADGVCRDTTIVAGHVDNLVVGKTLGKVPPLYIPIAPVAEYQLLREPSLKNSFFEIGPWAGYVGSDSSSAPKIGIPDVTYGVEALYAPFGSMLGEKLALALGGGVFFEDGRMRLPVMGHLRYSFVTPSRKESIQYVPDACRFDCGVVAGGDTITPPEGSVRRDGPDSVDKSAILLRKTVIEYPEHAPYIFVEGGPIFNGPFEGAWARPSVNPEEYNQYQVGAGGGIPITSWLHAQLAYRYMRLNLRTPCESCTDVYQVNTNNVHAVMLRIMIAWGW
jgi:hypothetical protein